MRVDGVTDKFARARDLERDGMVLECERIDPEGVRTPVVEALWHDL